LPAANEPALELSKVTQPPEIRPATGATGSAAVESNNFGKSEI
jgi:hypothetical protein